MEMIKNAFKWLFKTIFTVIIVFAVLIFFLTAFIAKLSFENVKQSAIPTNSFLLLSFPHGLAESPNEMIDLANFKVSNINQRNLIFGEVLQKIAFASQDSRIKGVLIDLDNWNLSYQHTNEISGAVKEFKAHGKSVTAYGSGFSKINYLAALSADEIVADPSNSSSIILNGISVSVPYFKELGDKLGMEVDVIHVGKFKGAGENFARKNMSDQFRISIERIIDDRLNLFAETVSFRRGIDQSEIATKIESGEMVFITPKEALEIKLVDRLMSFEDLKEEIGAGEKQIINISNYENEFNDFGSNSEDRIAVIYAEGNIIDHDDESVFSEPVINPAKIDRIIRKIKKDKGIKAVVLRVNSPGGSALASEKILRRIIELKKEIPVIVSMGSTAASGGYYISCHGTKIFADPYTITGSIGVVSMIPNMSKLFDKIGIKNERISRGKYSDIFDLTKESSFEDSVLLAHSMGKIYEEFKGRVSSGRNISPENLELIAQGQIWTGRQAKSNGLVDEVGGLNAAIEEAAKLTGLTSFETVSFPENRTFSEKLFSMEIEDSSVLNPNDLKGIFRNEAEYLKNIILFGNKPSLLMPVMFE
jgi:protease-4